MEKIKAVVKCVDAIGRMVLLNDRNEVVLLYGVDPHKYTAGQEIFIIREDGKRRMSDWKIVE